MSFEKHFLEQYNIHNKPEAIEAAERKEQRTGESGIAQDRSQRIEAYIERLEEIFLHPDEEKRDRRTEIFKEKFLYPRVIVKAEDFPESYWEYQKQEMKKRGLGEAELTDEQKQQEIANMQEKQKISLNAWIDHLTGEDCHYPADIKYFVAQGVLKTGGFDGQAYRFNDREKSTAAPFYQIDHEALSMVMGALEVVHHNGDATPYHAELLDLISRNKSFGHMYAEAMRYLDKMGEKDKALDITDGEWRIFRQDSDPQELVKAFEGKRAYLCLGNIGDASGYLRQGDMHVYFSNNRAGIPTTPRIAIAVKPNMGAYEARGTWNANEDIDPIITQTSILKEHLAGIPNGEAFAKKDADMKKVTKLYDKCFNIDRKTGEKTYLNPDLTKDDITFLYEFDQPIEGFGLEKDPRIQELHDQRNPEEDMSIFFECQKEQIAHNTEEVNEDTIVYIGEWNPKIYRITKQFPNIKHLYESFPEKKMFMQTLETDSNINSPEKAEEAIKSKNIHLADGGKDILYKTEFSHEGKTYELVRFTVEQLGFPKEGAAMKKIIGTKNDIDKNGNPAPFTIGAMTKFGLGLCPAEVGPHLRLKYPGKEYFLIAMKQIADHDGNPSVFFLNRSGGWLRLNTRNAEPGYWWGSSDGFVFLSRK